MIEASFERGQSRSAAVGGAYQYDVGQRLRLRGLPTPEELARRDDFLSGDKVTVQAQFAFVGDSQTQMRLASYDEREGVWLAAVPDIYMMQSRDVHVYVYVGYGQTEESCRAKTCYEAVFRPIGRPAPGDAVTPDQVNAWDALVQEINLTMATMHTSISETNAAGALAKTEAENANEAASEARTAAAQAQEASDDVSKAWMQAKVSATTLEPYEPATVMLTEENGVKRLTYGIPRGQDGAQGPQGPKGDMGPAGVTFTLRDTVLYITTG